MDVLRALWRNGGSVVISAAVATWLSTPYGLIVGPLLHGLAETARVYFKQQNKPIPWYLDGLPF